MEETYKEWLELNLPHQGSLTNTVLSIVRRLLEENGIDYLSVTGRTKDLEGIREKIKRKKYKNPIEEMTDISGIRIILFIESDLEAVNTIIKKSFDIDVENSSNQDQLLNLNQVGYRSHHFVCELGESRCNLPEFASYNGLKFEFQVRTVLQHAWAELAHDRSYKFETELPEQIQRKLYLYAGLLEIADKGFSEIAIEIDEYSSSVSEKYSTGNLDVPINSLSLQQYFKSWISKHGLEVDDGLQDSLSLAELAGELSKFGIGTIEELSSLCPQGYADMVKDEKLSFNILSTFRNWMLIKDAKKLLYDLGVSWTIEPYDEDTDLLKTFCTDENFDIIVRYSER